MTPTQAAHIMSLVQQHAAAVLNGLPTTHKLFEQIEAALSDAPQAEPVVSHEREATGVVTQKTANVNDKPQQAEGWVMVPVEPTWDMQMAASSNYREPRDGHYTARMECAADAYRAMLAARPSAPTAVEPDEPRKADDVDQLLRAVFELCEATEDAPEVEPKNEHQRGFDKGRRFEAKAIRRAVGDWFQTTFCGQSFMGEPVLKKPDAPHCIDGDCHLCATPHTEAVRMSEAEIRDMVTEWIDESESHIRYGINLARDVEQATAARLGVKMGDV